MSGARQCRFAGAAVLIALAHVRFESLTGSKLRLYVLVDPAPGNDGNDGNDEPRQGAGGLGRRCGERRGGRAQAVGDHERLRGQVRLAWSIDAGRPVETPSIVACRYTGRGC